MAWQTRDQKERVIKSMFRDIEDPSSFGAIGYVGVAGDQRRRGLVGYREKVLRSVENPVITPIVDAKGIDFISTLVRYGKERIAQEDRTRLTVRVLVNPFLVNALRGDIYPSASVEAVVPVNPRYSLVYIGYNAMERGFKRENQELSMKMASYEPQPRPAQVPHPRTYNIALYDRGDRSNSSIFSAEDAAQTAEILHSFGHSPESAARVLSNPNAILGTIQVSLGDFRHAIVGTCIAERVTIQLNTGEQLGLVEITDAKIRDEHQGNGLYYDVSTALINGIINDNGRGRNVTDLVFAESNVQNSSLVKTALLQGRSFTGLLQNHVSIDGNLKDFAVTYLQGEALRTPIMESLRH